MSLKRRHAILLLSRSCAWRPSVLPVAGLLWALCGVQPEIDSRTLKEVTLRCPRIRVVGVADCVSTQLDMTLPADLEPLDAAFVQNLSIGRVWEEEWEASSLPQEGPSSRSTGRVSIAERFRLAYEERDRRLAPQRARNARRRLRRDAMKAQNVDTWTRARSLAAAFEKKR